MNYPRQNASQKTPKFEVLSIRLRRSITFGQTGKLDGISARRRWSDNQDLAPPFTPLSIIQAGL
jgi:hypothetical protein